MAPPMAGTLDRKAMIMDSSSESSGEHRPPAHAYDGFSVSVIFFNTVGIFSLLITGSFGR